MVIRVTKKISWGGRMLAPADTISLSKTEAAHFIRKGLGVEYVEAGDVVAEDVAATAVAEVFGGDPEGSEFLDAPAATPSNVKVEHVGGGWHKILVDGAIHGKMHRTKDAALAAVAAGLESGEIKAGN